MNYKKILVVMFILCLSFNFYGIKKKDKKPEPKMPTNVQMIAQSCDINDLYITVIDLDNNEIVVIEYNTGKIDRIIRTGMFVNPKTQTALNGTDMPFENED